MNIKSKKGILILISIIILLVIFFIFMEKSSYKTFKLGDTNIERTISQIEKDILSINSYKAQVTIKVKSNKNENEYTATQEFIKPNLYKMELNAPESVKGICITYDGSSLKLTNSKLNLDKIYGEYKEITNNNMFLNKFVEDYVSIENSTYEVKDNVVIFSTPILNGSKYAKTKKLYVDCNTGLPTRLEINDVNQNVLVYILYNEIDLNSLKKDEIFI